MFRFTESTRVSADRRRMLSNKMPDDLQQHLLMQMDDDYNGAFFLKMAVKKGFS